MENESEKNMNTTSLDTVNQLKENKMSSQINEDVSEHMARTMHIAELAKQADERKKKETSAKDNQSDMPNVTSIDDTDELPSRGRTDGVKYARIDSISEQDEDPELLAAIMNRGQAPKQGDGNENGQPIMDSSTKPKPMNNTDIMALAKEMEKNR